jgi:Ca2+-binding EF-hand superfamily protein
MADSRRTGYVRFSDILVALEKVLPSLTKEFLEQVPVAFMRNPEDMLSQADFESLFAPNSQVSYSNTMPKPSAQKIKNKVDARVEHNEEYTGYIKHLAQTLENDGTKPSSFFRQLDRQRNGILQCREIKDGVKDNLPEAFGGMNFNKLEKALDLNGTGIISEEEFVKVVSEAKQSSVSTGQYQRISSAVMPGRSPGKLGKKTEAKAVGLVDTVLPQHKQTSQQMVDRFTKLVRVEQSIGNPIDEVETVFDKITAWKKGKQNRDSEEQEEFIAKKLKPLENIAVHNIKTVETQLQGLQGEIGLTDNEMTVIMFTSLDRDYLTNMIIMQGEYMKWFTSNFEGESGDEDDFKAAKVEIWAAVVTLAMEIISWWGRPDNKKKDVFSEKEWNKIRYGTFATQLADKLRDQSIKQELRKMFKDQHDQLSYFDFFQYLEKLKIKLEDWEEDGLENRLDRLGMAFIEFNEFNEFCMEFDIDWGEKLLENDLED